MQDRYKTFLYSRAQGELVGTDGEKTFNAVFGEQARIVAVLLRPEWGQTPWTRIEETAIRNAIRAGETVDVDQSALDRKPAAIPKDWREIDNVVVHRPGSEVSFRWRGKDAGAP
jgi:hypothetical protein